MKATNASKSLVPFQTKAGGSPVVDLNGNVVGVVTSSHEQGATTKVVRPATTTSRNNSDLLWRKLSQARQLVGP